VLTIAGGVILGVLGLAVVAEVVRWWTSRGHTVMGAIALLLVIGAGGAVGLYVIAAYTTQRSERQWDADQRVAAAAQGRQDSVRVASAHDAWCATWAGAAVPDSGCASWVVDTAPPSVLGDVVRQHARRRFADTLAAATELAIFAREVAATRLEVADILPTWNRWASTHPTADAFGRFQAAALVREACALGQPHHSTVEADLRSLSGHTEWCFRSWWADSTIFAASAPPRSR
jgi:hypothetical protein